MSKRAKTAVSLLCTARLFLRSGDAGDLRRAIERWGAARMLQGAAAGHHDRLLTNACALVRDEIFARLP